MSRRLREPSSGATPPKSGLWATAPRYDPLPPHQHPISSTSTAAHQNLNTPFASCLSDCTVLFITWHVQVWLGYQQSLRPSHAGLTLNVDMAATAFLEPQMVIDFLQKAAGLRSPQEFAHLTPMQHRKATKAITGLRVSQTTCAI